MLTRLRLALIAGTFGALMAAAGPAVAARGDDPLPRFEDPLCPGVVGMRQDVAEMIVGRVRENAVGLGRRLASAEKGCEANLVIAFVDDPRAYLERLRKDRAYLLRELDPEERAELMSDAAVPARALLRVRAYSRDGMPIGRADNLVHPPQTTMWMAHSKIYTATRNEIISSLVLIDRDAIDGLTVAQLADYATFRALAHIRHVPETVRSGSILSLFDAGPERPAQLTEFDRAFLRTFYEGEPNLPGSVRLAALEAATGRRLSE